MDTDTTKNPAVISVSAYDFTHYPLPRLEQRVRRAELVLGPFVVAEADHRFISREHIRFFWHQEPIPLIRAARHRFQLILYLSDGRSVILRALPNSVASYHPLSDDTEVVAYDAVALDGRRQQLMTTDFLICPRWMSDHSHEAGIYV